MTALTPAKTKAAEQMSSKFRGLSVQKRMDLAVKAVMSGDMNQSEAARHHGVSRPRLNINVNQEKNKFGVLADRAERALHERRASTEPTPAPAPGAGDHRPMPTFEEFCRKYFGNVECPDCGKHHELPEFHTEMMSTLEGPDKRLLINCPPYHAKSTICTVYHSVYELCRDPNVRILIVCKSQKLAERFLYQIQKLISDPSLYPDDANLIADWGPFTTGNEQWNKSQLYIAGNNSSEKDPSVSALGVGGHIYGVRADIIKFDDIADLENQRNADRVSEMLVWCTQEAASRVGRNGKLHFIGTRISAGDIYSHLQNLPAFKVLRWPCILDEEDQRTLWQDHFPYENAVNQRDSMSTEQWQLVYQNVDTPGFGASFPLEVIEATYDADRALGQYDPRWALICGLDPAGAGEQAGYTALVLLGVDLTTGNRYLVDLVNAKQMKAPQLRDQLFEWADRYPLRELRVESNGLQSQLVQYNQEIQMRMTSRGVRVVPHITTKHNKWDPQFGVEAMATMFYNRMISLPTRDVASRNRIRPLVEQLAAFPMGQVTDLVMAMWFAELGVKDVYTRSSVPLFDPRVKLPPRLARKRHVVDFADGTIHGAPSDEQDPFGGAGRQMFGDAPRLREVRLANVNGTIFVP